MFNKRLLPLFTDVKSRHLSWRILRNLRWKSNSSCDSFDAEQNEKKTKEMSEEVALPPEPTFCCMSGCANCVWIKYAQEITQLFDNGDEIAKSKISEKVHDPKLRAYLFKQLGLEEYEEKK